MPIATKEAVSKATKHSQSTNTSSPEMKLDPQELAEYMRSGRPLKDLLGLGDHIWETMYDFGYRNFANGQYELAEHWWTYTCMFDSKRERNWIALGVACKRQKKYEKALDAFSLAVHFGSTNPWAPLHAAECHLLKDSLSQAAGALDDAEAWAANIEEKDVILKRAKMFRRGIRKRLEKLSPETRRGDRGSNNRQKTT